MRAARQPVGRGIYVTDRLSAPAQIAKVLPLSDPGQRLGEVVDAARLDLGLSKMDLAKVARVGRSTITDLINRGKVPGKSRAPA
ncbi:hypothetical protein MARA_00030 (plasmid) [Mycolicibacterium arabiense]|uniref:Uncharacterized protein n=1 Tax=Mycolicibacterium arabiense TaxID=1286181 RepID=A0A7I7RPV7_9MYCO|nr:hypothetical protein MARA_00030 [Mycolicibacterium arabiense]